MIVRIEKFVELLSVGPKFRAARVPEATSDAIAVAAAARRGHVSGRPRLSFFIFGLSKQADDAERATGARLP